MRIDSSAIKLWHECPMKYYERYVTRLETVRDSAPLQFGTRMHQLLEEFYSQAPRPHTPLDDEALEAEAQATFAAYQAHYPVEDFEVVETEQTFEVGLPSYMDTSCTARDSEIRQHHPLALSTGPCNVSGCDGEGYSWPHHTLVGKIDMRVRRDGHLWLFETKTEKRSSSANDPEAWAARYQVSLYKWAAEQLFGGPVEGIILNVITRQSPKAQEPPLFRRDHLQRTAAQLEEAVANAIWVANQIEEMQRTGFWPADRERCKFGNWKCDYFAIHVTGRTPENLRQFKPAEDYLGL